MAVLSISALKALFSTGKKPTEPNYIDFIDTLFARSLKSNVTALASVVNIQVPLHAMFIHYEQTITAAGDEIFSFDATAAYEQNWVEVGLIITNNHTADVIRTFPSGWRVEFGVGDDTVATYSAGSLTIKAGKEVEVSIKNGNKKRVRIGKTGEDVI